MKRFHEGEGKDGKHSCNFCGKLFFYKSEKLAHESTHTGKKEFKCDCGKEYSSKKALKDHVKIVHSEKAETHICHVSKGSDFGLCYEARLQSLLCFRFAGNRSGTSTN